MYSFIFSVLYNYIEFKICFCLICRYREKAACVNRRSKSEAGSVVGSLEVEKKVRRMLRKKET